MIKIAILASVAVIGLAACTTSEPAQYTTEVVEQQVVEPEVKTSVTDLSIDKNPDQSFNCTLAPASVSQLNQAIAQKSTKALKSANLQPTSAEYLMASELITSKPAQVSFYDRQKFNFCVLGRS